MLAVVVVVVAAGPTYAAVAGGASPSVARLWTLAGIVGQSGADEAF